MGRSRREASVVAGGAILLLLLPNCLLSVAAAGDLGERPLKSAQEVGFTQHWGELSEKQRLKLRSEAGWKWEFPGEPPAYAAWQERRRAEIMDLYHYQERLDNWVQYVQIRSVRNFTRMGFDVVDAPRELHERLRKRLREGMERGARHEMGGKPQGIYGDTAPDFVNHGESSVLEQLLPIHEEWTPSAGKLKPVTAYGMRVYRRGASLAWHADRVDTHIVSSIFHIDHQYDSEDEPWPIEIEAHDGTRHAVALKPGQMLLYESAKCPHGRSSALKGDWYASLFSHFMPADRGKWPYSQHDVWLAVPGGWDKPPITHSGEGRWAGAFLTHDSMEVKGMVERDPKEQHPGARLRIPRAVMHNEPLHYEAEREAEKADAGKADAEKTEAGKADAGKAESRLAEAEKAFRALQAEHEEQLLAKANAHAPSLTVVGKEKGDHKKEQHQAKEAEHLVIQYGGGGDGGGNGDSGNGGGSGGGGGGESSGGTGGGEKGNAEATGWNKDKAGTVGRIVRHNDDDDDGKKLGGLASELEKNGRKDNEKKDKKKKDEAAAAGAGGKGEEPVGATAKEAAEEGSPERHIDKQAAAQQAAAQQAAAQQAAAQQAAAQQAAAQQAAAEEEAAAAAAAAANRRLAMPVAGREQRPRGAEEPKQRSEKRAAGRRMATNGLARRKPRGDDLVIPDDDDPVVSGGVHDGKVQIHAGRSSGGRGSAYDDDDDDVFAEEILEVVEEGAALSAVVLALYVCAGGSVVTLGLMVRRAVVSRSCRPIMRNPGKHAKTENDEGGAI